MSILFEQEAGPQPPREIRSPIEINALLKNLQQSRDPLIVTFADRMQTFQSFIVRINSDSGQLWIDEMIPREGDRYASQGEAFKIEAWHEGIHMRWESQGAQKVILDDAPAYCTPLPQELYYHQKRGAFRATVRLSLETAIGLGHHKRDINLNGHLMDISATGCKARLSGNRSNVLQAGEVFESSYLELPESGRLATAMEIRHVSFEEHLDETHVGLKFRQPSPAVQRQIDRYVNFLQRDARRFEKDDLF